MRKGRTPRERGWRKKRNVVSPLSFFWERRQTWSERDTREEKEAGNESTRSIKFSREIYSQNDEDWEALFMLNCLSSHSLISSCIYLSPCVQHGVYTHTYVYIERDRQRDRYTAITKLGSNRVTRYIYVYVYRTKTVSLSPVTIQ